MLGPECLSTGEGSAKQRKCLKDNGGDWKVGSTVKSTHYPHTGLGFDSHHPHGGSRLSVTLVPEDPTPSSDLHRHQTGIWCADMHNRAVIHGEAYNKSNKLGT